MSKTKYIRPTKEELEKFYAKLPKANQPIEPPPKEPKRAATNTNG